jgi:hypothetical protein
MYPVSLGLFLTTRTRFVFRHGRACPPCAAHLMDLSSTRRPGVAERLDVSQRASHSTTSPDIAIWSCCSWSSDENRNAPSFSFLVSITTSQVPCPCPLSAASRAHEVGRGCATAVQGKSMVFGSVQIPFGCVQRFTAGGRLGGRSGIGSQHGATKNHVSIDRMENSVDCCLLVAQGQRVHCRAIGEHDRIFH